MGWKEAQDWERSWWGSCSNTLGEEIKQLLYADRMGLQSYHDGKSPYNFDLGGASVLDVGGGPTSLLLRCNNYPSAAVVDPLVIPEWVRQRYHTVGIKFLQHRAEDIGFLFGPGSWDEVWIYNVLQHTDDPELIVHNARRCGSIIRLFEWVDTRVNQGHPHSLSKELLDSWLKGDGKVETLTGQSNCYGKCYYGIFPT
jgi:hypothetical protein